MKKTRGKKRKASSPKKSSSSKKSNKKVSFLKKFLPLLIIIAILLAIAFLLNAVATGNAVSNDGSTPFNEPVVITEGRWSETWTFLSSDGFFAKIFMYIFGVPISSSAINEVSAGIITLSVWLLLFITFSDIIASFSTFSKWVSWGIGFLVAVIAANLGFIVAITTWFIGLFAFLGTLSVVVGLTIAFVAFIAINIGVGKFAEWALKRRATMSAHQAAAGGKKVAGAIEGLGDIGKSLQKLGEK